MKRLFLAACAILTLAVSAPAAAHEFWMQAEPFAARAGDVARLTLHVGEYFTGDSIPFSAAHIAQLRHFAERKYTDLLGRLSGDAVLPELRLRLPRAGTQLIAFDSQPTDITLPADKFHAYLHDEGLDAVIRQREAAGKAQQPGRERYRRNVKTLLGVDGRTDATWAVATGQKLEIVPLIDPLTQKAGNVLGFRLDYDGKPLPGALVKAWHKRVDGGSEQTLMIRARTAADGRVAFRLPYAGMWMFSVVHMVPAAETAEVDWESYWGNLTFELPSSAN